MSKISFIKSLLFTGFAMVCLNCTAFAAMPGTSSNNTNSKVPTDQIGIYEKDDEEKAYDEHGYTRGDIAYLYKAHFDPSKVETLSGEVEEVMRVKYPDNDCYLIAIISTSTNKSRVALNLGPAWYLEEKDFTVNEGDEVQVKGSKLRVNGRNVMIVEDLTVDGKTLNIRDKEGSSLWGSPKAQKGNAECMKPTKRKMSWGS